MRLKTWHCLALLSLLVLSAYYPNLHAGFNSVDDLKMINRIDAAGPIDLEQHFFPQNKRYYYRPLTTLTFLVDRDAWGTIASFMHLENMLLHLGCALMVYVVTRRLSRLHGFSGEAVPLTAALLFALHPLTTEPVCWISGRTDLLSGLFILLAVWLVIAGLEARRTWMILVSAPALLLSCLSKEVGVFILPALLWMIVFFPREQAGWMSRLRERWLALVMPTVAVASYFVMRSLASARDTGIKTAVKGAVGGGHDLLDKLRIALKIYGFYLKKVLIPWPLNFGIVEVSAWYIVAGGVLAGTLIWCAVRRDLLGSLGLMAFCVLSPAILIPFGKMAWTPVAERYLYIPLALLAPVSAIVLFSWWQRLHAGGHQRLVTTLAALILVFFASSLHRAWIWQDNLRLYRDTVAKSPEFPLAKAELAAALSKRGHHKEAQQTLKELGRVQHGSDFILDDVNLAKMHLAKGEVEQASAILRKNLNSKNKMYHEILQDLIIANDMRWTKASVENRQEIDRESLAWLYEQQRVRPSNFTLYRIGKQHLRLGDKEQALSTLRQVYAQAPVEAYYKDPARKMIERLEYSLAGANP